MSTVTTSAQSPASVMHSIIQRIATGPELSKDISLEEARLGMRAILDGEVDPVQAGIFLIALRMKRETDDENLGVLEAIREVTTIVTTDVDEVFDVADPYDGYNRSLPPSPFLPALLAECGIPAVSHGVESIGPKYGITHHQVLRAAGVPVDLSPEEGAARIADARLGWAYLDQRQCSPRLYALARLRSLIVKRPAITTVETLVGPVRGRKKTHVITGYVHKPYPRIYAMLARHAGFDSALVVRGVEGGVIPSLRQEGKLFRYRDRGEEQALDVRPADFGIEASVRSVPLPAELGEAKEGGDEVAVKFDVESAARATADAGLAALGGSAGATRDALTYAAAICLWHLGRFDTLLAAADHARKALDSGRALKRFEAARR